MDAKHGAKDEKRTKNSKRIGCKLGRNDPKRLRILMMKGVKRKPKDGMKKFLIQGQAAKLAKCSWSSSPGT